VSIKRGKWRDLLANKWVITCGLMSPPVYRAVIHDEHGDECQWLPWEHSEVMAESHVPEDGHKILRGYP